MDDDVINNWFKDGGWVALLLAALLAIGIWVVFFPPNDNQAESSSANSVESEQTIEIKATDADSVKPVGSESSPAVSASVECIDVTTYDYDWNNDMLCTNPDGSKFYTDYAGARAYSP